MSSSLLQLLAVTLLHACCGGIVLACKSDAYVRTFCCAQTDRPCADRLCGCMEGSGGSETAQCRLRQRRLRAWQACICRGCHQAAGWVRLAAGTQIVLLGEVFCCVEQVAY